MTRGKSIACFITIYCGMLLTFAPATLVDRALRNASDGKAGIAVAEGSAWKGSGRLLIQDAAGRQAIAKDVQWRVRPESLWHGKLICDFSLDGGRSMFTVYASMSTLEVPDAAIELPAEVLSIAEPRLAPLRLSGRAAIRTQRLQLGRGGIAGTLMMRWLDAGSAFSPVNPIGSYELKLDGEGKSVRASLTTLSGPVTISGSGKWVEGAAAEFFAIANVAPEIRDQLSPLLRLIAVQKDDGVFELRLR